MASADGGAYAPTLDSVDESLEVTRRLSDKILSAFNHAYAIGELVIAQRLREVLKENQDKLSEAPERRDRYDPLGQADLWVAFVEARNRYKSACENRTAEPGGEPETLDAMKQAYKLWSLS